MTCFYFKNKNYIISRVFLFFSLVLFNSSCSENQIPPNTPSGFIQIKGSDTLVNAAQVLAEEFMKKYPYVYIAVTGGGSGVGIASLINKTCDIATSSREIKPKEIEMAKKENVEPCEFTVAYDGIAIIVNKNNPITKLNVKELHNIFTGKITNWKELGGKNLKIVALSREVNSGTHMYFKEEVIRLGNKNSKEEFSSGVLLLSSSQAIVEETANNESAIGYLGMGYICDKIKVLALSKDGTNYYYPQIENIISKKYPLARPLYFYTNGKPTGIIKLFIEYTLSTEGQMQFKKIGFVPINLEDASKN